MLQQKQLCTRKLNCEQLLWSTNGKFLSNIPPIDLIVHYHNTYYLQYVSVLYTFFFFLFCIILLCLFQYDGNSPEVIVILDFRQSPRYQCTLRQLRINCKIKEKLNFILVYKPQRNGPVSVLFVFKYKFFSFLCVKISKIQFLNVV